MLPKNVQSLDRAYRLSIPFGMLLGVLDGPVGAAVLRFQFLLGCYEDSLGEGIREGLFLSIPFGMLRWPR